MTEPLPPAHAIRPAPLTGPVHDLVTLHYHERLIRRKRLITAHDESFVVDLAETVSLGHGDRFVLADGRLIEVIAAPEALMLMPLGQTKAQEVLAALAPLCQTLRQAAATLTVDGIGSCVFAIDIATMRHDVQEPRMFRS